VFPLAQINDREQIAKQVTDRRHPRQLHMIAKPPPWLVFLPTQINDREQITSAGHRPPSSLPITHK